MAICLLRALRLVGLFPSARVFRDPSQRSIIDIRASYHQETRAAAKDLIESLEMGKIAVFYQ
jgi:hypothetical protein